MLWTSVSASTYQCRCLDFHLKRVDGCACYVRRTSRGAPIAVIVVVNVCIIVALVRYLEGMVQSWFPSSMMRPLVFLVKFHSESHVHLKEGVETISPACA